MSTTFATPAELLGAVGQPLGKSEWLTITQERIDRFADATGDHQWIHVDPERAKTGPFGAPSPTATSPCRWSISSCPQIVEVRGISMGVNYGADRLRFPAPVPVGSRVRGGAELLRAEPEAGGVQATIRVTVEIEGERTAPAA